MLGTYETGQWQPHPGGEMYYLDRVDRPAFVVRARPVTPGEDDPYSVVLDVWSVTGWGPDGLPDLSWQTEPYLSVYARAGGCEHFAFAPLETSEEGKPLKRGDGYLHFCGAETLGGHLRLMVAIYRHLADRFAGCAAGQDLATELGFTDQAGTLADARLVPCPRYGTATTRVGVGDGAGAGETTR